MSEHSDNLQKMIRAAKKLLPKRAEADKVLTELQRIDRAERQAVSESTIGETEPEA